jgi:hypothetical protein
MLQEAFVYFSVCHSSCFRILQQTVGKSCYSYSDYLQAFKSLTVGNCNTFSQTKSRISLYVWTVVTLADKEALKFSTEYF